MKIVVTGASGLLGSSFLTMYASSYEICSFYNKHTPLAGIPIRIDLTDFDLLDRVVRSRKPDVILHAAALTDVDLCEREKELAMKVNHEVTARLASLAKESGAFMVYVSTDYVFDGSKGSYREEDEPNPINHYGYSKLKGEEAVKETLEQFCIARASVLYGPSPCVGKTNFALWLIDMLGKREKVNVLVDQYVSPTLSSNLAEMLNEVIERRLTGIYHLSGATRVSRYEFARKLCNVFHLDDSLLRPASMKEMSWIARRPIDSSLDVSKAMQRLNKKPLNIDDALARLKEEMAK
jgi:dTDP-4-dehydrorhamnose reductase